MKIRTAFFLPAAAILSLSLLRADGPSATELSGKLSAAVLDNSSVARLKMDFSANGKKTVLQLKADARRTSAASDVRYLVLWPKERKGESFVLRKSGNQAATGLVFLPPASLKPLSPSQMQDGIFGSDLAYADLVENYFAWANQSLVGEETVNRAACQILESKPGKGDRSGYGSVKTWVDTQRMVPLKIEKYAPNGQLIRRITITLCAKDDTGRLIPANFRVERPGDQSVTTMEGSNIKHDVPLTDADFSPESLRSPAAKDSPNPHAGAGL